MKELVKKLRSHVPLIYYFILGLLSWVIVKLMSRIVIHGNKNVLQLGFSIILKSKIKINGNNNIVKISKETILKNCRIIIMGNDHKLTIGSRVKLFDTELWFEDDENSIEIGSMTTINGAHIAITENKHLIRIGEDCLFSKEIDIRNGDSHSIIDLNTNTRINYAGDIKIGNHVWLAKNVKILKNSDIGDNCILGTNSLISGDIPHNSLAVGSPAKIIKSNVTWTRERI